MPVEILSFDGKAIDEKSIELNWVTLSENNNSGFVVEHSSDGFLWEEIGFVDGMGSSDILQEYKFLDKHPEIGNNYYRLKQIDFNDQYEYSNVINIKFSNESKIDIYPNPTTGKINIKGIDTELTEIEIYDSLGKLVRYLPQNMGNVDISELPIGVYFISIKSNNFKFTKRIMKIFK